MSSTSTSKQNANILAFKQLKNASSEGSQKGLQHDARTAVLTEDAFEPAELLSSLRVRITDHYGLRHPVFDYIETTAHRTELEKFARSELEMQRCLASYPRDDHLREPWSAGGRSHSVHVEDKSAQGEFANAYSNLLRRVLSKADKYESSAPFLALDHEVVTSIESIKNSPLVDHSVIQPIVYLLQTYQYHKTLTGYHRVGIVFEDFTADNAPSFSDNTVDITLKDILRTHPTDGTDLAGSVIHFMDWRVDYYDALLNDILWA